MRSSSSSIGSSGSLIGSPSLTISTTKFSVTSRMVRPTSSSSAGRLYAPARTICTSRALRLRLWTSSMPSFRVRPLQDRGMPAGPNLIMSRATRL